MGGLFGGKHKTTPLANYRKKEKQEQEKRFKDKRERFRAYGADMIAEDDDYTSFLTQGDTTLSNASLLSIGDVLGE